MVDSESKLVYDGSQNPNLLQFTVMSLVPGKEYGFYV